MEDIIKTILDVVRAQHTAAEGTETEPFNMDDIVDMAMGVMGRPDETEEETQMMESIQKMVESLAPDLFPPKTFEQMDDTERAASAVNMIEARLKNGFGGRGASGAGRDSNGSANDAGIGSGADGEAGAHSEKKASGAEPAGTSSSAFADSFSAENISNGEEARADGLSDNTSGTFDAKETADLNDMIYNNLMQMMGLQNPQVEYPFDRSQIRYGKEKSFTEQLEEEREDRQPEPQRQLSAWELAQAAIDKDESAHQKEPYVPKPVEVPDTKSASQLAAEAIARSQEEDKVKLEIEKKAEMLMVEAKKRGQDPMKFALHQQEILRYMEKNSDELVSFEDYEDLSPEEKLEIERQIQIEKQIEAGVDPDKVNPEVPEEYIPKELKEPAPKEENDSGADENTEKAPAFTEEMLRQLSQEVIRENSGMILADNADEDMESLNEAIFENIKKMMAGSGQAVPQENVDDLLSQVVKANTAPAPTDFAAEDREKEANRGLSAVELAMAAQKAARPEPQEVRETKSAVDLAREAQEKEKVKKKAPAGIMDELELMEDDLEFDELDLAFAEENNTSAEEGEQRQEADQTQKRGEDQSQETGQNLAAEQNQEGSREQEAGMIRETEQTGEQNQETGEEEKHSTDDSPAKEETKQHDSSSADSGQEASKPEEDSSEEEYEYVDPDEMVLGEHTQAEIDEAMANLATLGLEGEVFERAKRMLLLELAGSESVLDAWLKEQENGKKKKAAVSALDEGDELSDLSGLDGDALEKELELAMDEDFFIDEEKEETHEEESLNQEAEEAADDTIPDEEPKGEPEAVSEAEGSLGDMDVPADAAAVENVAQEEFLEAVDAEILSEAGMEEPEAPEKKSQTKTSGSRRKKKVVRKKDKITDKTTEQKNGGMAAKEKVYGKADVEEKGYQVSVRKPFVLKNSASFMNQFEEYIADTQENRRLSTGFKKLDAMLRYGLHKGSYFIDAQPQYLKNSFMQQIADRAAEAGVDVLYISTELSRYDLMVETIARLSYEIHQGDPEKAVSVMSIMTGADGADLASLKDELNWYRGRISEHLFILDQEAVSEYVETMEDASAGDILTELIRSIVREGAHKPAVFIDNIENILSTEDSEDMKPLMDGMRMLAKELGIPILMSYGYAQAESEEELYPEEKEYHASLGNMCDVYLELQYADMITEDSVELTREDIREMTEEGETLLLDVNLYKNRRPMKASCQIQGTPKYNYFEE